MMNAEQSPLKKVWKYVLLIPTIAAALFLLNCTGEITSAKATEPEVEYDREVIIGKVINTTNPAVQDTNDRGEKSYNFSDVDKKPLFPGGNDKIMRFVSENFKYPAEAREAGIQGTIYVQFTVQKDGSIDSVEVVRGDDLGGGLPEEAVRVVKAMPDWTPAEHNGQKVNVSYTLPVFARLSKKPTGEEESVPVRTWSLSMSFADVDKKPQFPGGNDKIMTYVGENFQYPAEAKENNIQGTVYVQFIISKNGSLQHVKAVRGKQLGGGLAEEAVRVVKSMPDWTPGEHQGEKVAVSYTLPIFARLQD